LLAQLAGVALATSARSWPTDGSKQQFLDRGLPVPPIYYDADGLIVHKGGAGHTIIDGGDTAQREGWYWVGVWIRKEILRDPWPQPRTLTFPEVIHLLEPAGDGIFYRHPKLPPWNNPYDKAFGFSRDQMTPLVAAMGLWGLIEPLRRLWNALPQDPVGGVKHTFNGEWQTILGKRVAYTGDIVGPASINHFRRSWNEDPSTSSDGNGAAGDAELASNVGLKLDGVLRDRDDTGDDLNLIVMLLTAALRFPSTTTRQASQTYGQRRLASYGSFARAYETAYRTNILDRGALTSDEREKLERGISSGWTPDASPVYGAVRWYHRAGTGANPALALLYEPIVARYFS
jgi:hypothetical protein